MNVWKELEIDNSMGKIEAVNHCSDYIRMGEDSADRLSRANAVIKALGGKAEKDPDEARVIANHMVGQVIDKREANQDEARAYMTKLFTANTFFRREAICAEPENKPIVRYVPKTARRKGERNTVRTRALAICAANSTMTNAELAGKMSKELKISYANAYYYASRVFKREQ